MGCRGGCWQVLLWWLCCKGLLDSGVDWGRWWEGVAPLSVGAAHLAVSLTWRPSPSRGAPQGVPIWSMVWQLGRPIRFLGGGGGGWVVGVQGECIVAMFRLSQFNTTINRALRGLHRNYVANIRVSQPPAAQYGDNGGVWEPGTDHTQTH